MSINELKDIIDAIAKRRDAYSVDEGLKDDALIIERVYDRFVVYYFERGSRFAEKWFENEADAVAHFHSKFEDSERWS